MGWACSTHASDKKYIQNFGQKTSREEATRETYAWVGRYVLVSSGSG
jgi:hypothetical protein